MLLTAFAMIVSKSARTYQYAFGYKWVIINFDETTKYFEFATTEARKCSNERFLGISSSMIFEQATRHLTDYGT